MGYFCPYVCFMKLYELTTGVIAAVLIALGAYQYVNRTTVEEEPVVKEDNKTVLHPAEDCVWYSYAGVNFSESGYDTQIVDYQQYVRFSPDNPSETPDCENGIQICAVCLPATTGDNPDQTQFSEITDEIQTGVPVTGLLKLEQEPDN